MDPINIESGICRCVSFTVGISVPPTNPFNFSNNLSNNVLSSSADILLNISPV